MSCDNELQDDVCEAMGDMIVHCGRIDLAPAAAGGAAVSARRGLSGRALNVLKLLAAEITGEEPPSRDWLPPDSLLRELSFERLTKARNCGPLTTVEIVRWARSREITIAPPCWAGKSFAQMWRYLEARFAAGELTPAELAEAIERSVKRKNTRIPVSMQRIFLKWLDMAGQAVQPHAAG